MSTILVSGASGIVGYGILKSLRQSKTKHLLIGTTVYEDSIAPAFCDIFERAPYTTDPKYINWLSEMIQKHKIEMIIPGINDDMLLWCEQKEKLAKTGVKILLNNPELIELCADKWLFYKELENKNPQYLIESRIAGSFDEFSSAYGMPFIMKPRKGFASKGIVIVDSEETFNQHAADLGTILIAQPIVGDKDSEYTISAFFDSESNLLAMMSMRRHLSKDGYTEKAEVAIPDGAQAVINDLASILKPVGPTNFQFRVHDGKLKLLEINPRISSATSIRTSFGYNESDMSVEYFLHNKKPVQPKILGGHAIRYTEDYIFYDSNNI